MHTIRLKASAIAVTLFVGAFAGYAYAGRDAHRIREDAEHAESAIRHAKEELFKIDHDFGGRKQEALDALENAAIIIHRGMESIR